MKIVVLSQLPPPVNGSTLMTEILINSLKSFGNEVLIIERKFSKSIFDINRFSTIKILRLICLIFRAQNILKSKPRTEIFICYFSSSRYAAIADFIICKQAERLKIPIILYFHTIPERFQKNSSFFYSRILSNLKVSKYVVLGEHMRYFFQNNLEISNVTVVPNTVVESNAREISLDVAQRLHGKLSSEIVFLSNLQPNKGLDQVLLFALNVTRKYPKINFKIIGPIVDPEYMNEIRNKLLEYRLETNFEFLGYVSGKQKFEILQAADFLLFTSKLREGQPLSILESLSVGTPVLTFPSGGSVDMIIHGYNGFVSDSIDSLADYYSSMLLSDNLYLTLRKHSIKFYEKHYSLDKYINSWRELISSY